MVDTVHLDEATAPADTDIVLTAGNGSVGNNDGGHIHLIPGLKAGAGEDGEIIVGNIAAPTVSITPPLASMNLYIYGADSEIADGTGGDIVISGGKGGPGDGGGGPVALHGGTATGVADAGSVELLAGSAINGNGGGIAINGGNSTTGSGGNVVLSPGTGVGGAPGAAAIQDSNGVGLQIISGFIFLGGLPTSDPGPSHAGALWYDPVTGLLKIALP